MIAEAAKAGGGKAGGGHFFFIIPIFAGANGWLILTRRVSEGLSKFGPH
jgi:hypothetical protein